jgi:hypothetical protein
MLALVTAVLVGVLTALSVYLGEYNVPPSISHGMDIPAPTLPKEAQAENVQGEEVRKHLYVCEFVSEDTAHIFVRELSEISLVRSCTEVSADIGVGQVVSLD